MSDEQKRETELRRTVNAAGEEEIIFEEVDLDAGKETDETQAKPQQKQETEVVDPKRFVKFPSGTKVRIKNYPPPADPRNHLDWNGKVGTVVHHMVVGRGLNNLPVCDYDVVFEKIEVPFTRLNPETRKLIRGVKIKDARNRFDESHLDKVS